MLQEELTYAILSDCINGIFCINKLYAFNTLGSVDGEVYGVGEYEAVPFSTISITIPIEEDTDATSLIVPTKPEPVIYCDALVTFITNSLLDITSGFAIKLLLITLSVTNPV